MRPPNRFYSSSHCRHMVPSPQVGRAFRAHCKYCLPLISNYSRYRFHRTLHATIFPTVRNSLLFIINISLYRFRLQYPKRNTRQRMNAYLWINKWEMLTFHLVHFRDRIAFWATFRQWVSADVCSAYEVYEMELESLARSAVVSEYPLGQQNHPVDWTHQEILPSKRTVRAVVSSTAPMELSKYQIPSDQDLPMKVRELAY